ncbi:hypothetical protein Ancab_021531 [Ancistrocladus abbreviatus]
MSPPTMPESQPKEQTGAGDPCSASGSMVLPQSDKQLSSLISIVRRSQRIQNASQNQELEPVVEEIRFSDGEKEDELPFLEENRSLDEKPEESRSASPDQIPAAVDAKYRRMYISSQKKVHVLVDENKELSKKLESALGKLEVYEEGNHILSEIWTVVSSMAKTTEKAVGLSVEAVAARGRRAASKQKVAKKKRVAESSPDE